MPATLFLQGSVPNAVTLGTEALGLEKTCDLG